MMLTAQTYAIPVAFLRRKGPHPFNGGGFGCVGIDMHRLNGQPARKKLDEAVRRRFLDQAAPIATDLKTLRGTVSCPADAPPGAWRGGGVRP